MGTVATAATCSSVFLDSACYLDGPVLALALIELGLVLHNVTLTKRIAIGNGAEMAEYVLAAGVRFDESEATFGIPPFCLAFDALDAAVISSALARTHCTMQHCPRENQCGRRGRQHRQRARR